MGRPLRNALGGIVYHVLNRSNGRATLFESDGDYFSFEQVLEQAYARLPTRVLAYCVMPNHWHFLLWPREDDELSEFMRWLTVTHTQRWHAHHGTTGFGHLYQGRFRSFPVESDEHFLTVARYIERNALRANLVERAEHWRWGSLWRRTRGDHAAQALLTPWPVEPPRDWLVRVNRPESQKDLEALRACVARGRPFGGKEWVEQTAQSLGLATTLRVRGRPRKRRQKGS
ncbi:MAG: transposase [Phycisphaerae bacterium]|nr:transposase [Phycisphaerae bacterium]